MALAYHDPEAKKLRAQERAKRKAARTQVPTTRQSAGFRAGEAAAPKGMPTSQREPQGLVDAHNTYQRPSVAPVSDYSRFSADPRQGVMEALGNRRNDLISSNEVALRQIGSDKAHGYESARIAEDAAREAYRAGNMDYRNQFQQSQNMLGNTRDEKISALQEALSKAQAGYGTADATRQIEEQDQFNRMKALYGNLGTMAGSQFTDAATRYGAFTQANRDQIRQTRTADELANLEERARANELYGSEIGRMQERGGELAKQLSAQQLQNLMTIQQSEDRSNREAAIRAQQANLGLTSGMNEAGLQSLNALVGFNEADRQAAMQQQEMDARMQQLRGQGIKDQAEYDLKFANLMGYYVDPETGETSPTLDAQRFAYDQTKKGTLTPQQQLDKQQQDYSIASSRGQLAKLAEQIGTQQLAPGQFGPPARTSPQAFAEQMNQAIYQMFPGNTTDAVQARRNLASWAATAYRNPSISGYYEEPRAQSDNTISAIKEYEQLKAAGGLPKKLDDSDPTLAEYVAFRTQGAATAGF